MEIWGKHEPVKIGEGCCNTSTAPCTGPSIWSTVRQELMKISINFIAKKFQGISQATVISVPTDTRPRFRTGAIGGEVGRWELRISMSVLPMMNDRVWVLCRPAEIGTTCCNQPITPSPGASSWLPAKLIQWASNVHIRAGKLKCILLVTGIAMSAAPMVEDAVIKIGGAELGRAILMPLLSPDSGWYLSGSTRSWTLTSNRRSDFYVGGQRTCVSDDFRGGY